MEAIEVGAGALALVQPAGTMGRSNSLVVLDGTDAVVVDTMVVPDLAAAIDREVHRRGGAVRVVVNTHPHVDHVGGNERFPGATILSLPATAEMVTALAGDTSFLPGLFPRYAEQLERLSVRPPQAVEPPDWRLPGGARVVAPGRAHSPGDLAIWLPDQRVLAAGDLCFHEVTPLALPGHASLRGWVAALDRLIALDPRVVVPGHGPLTDVHTLHAVRGYLCEVLRLAAGLARGELTQPEALAQLAAGPLADWAEPGRSAGNLAVAVAEVTGVAAENRRTPPGLRTPTTP